MITEKYRPSLKDFIGNRDGLERLEQCILELTPVILYGEPGVGKTSAVYAVAEKLGFKVVETNASDERKAEQLKDMLRRVKMRGFGTRLVYLFDEVDGAGVNGRLLAKIAKESLHSVVFAANQLHKVPKELRERCEKIRFYRPSLTSIVRHVKEIAQKEGVKARFDQVSEDVRASINAVLFGGEKYSETSLFDVVTRLLRGKPVDLENLSFEDRRWLTVWIMDNLPRFYDGAELYRAYQLLCLVDLTGDLRLCLNFWPGRRTKAIYPFYLRRLKALRGSAEIG